MSLKQYLTEANVALGVAASDKAAVMSKLASLAAGITGLDEKHLRRSLLARERLGSTGLGRGVAIPHALVAELEHPVVLFVGLKEAIEFDAADGQPVDLLCAILWPRENRNGFLPFLASVCRAFRNERKCALLRSATSPAAVLMTLVFDSGTAVGSMRLRTVESCALAIRPACLSVPDERPPRMPPGKP